MNLCALGSFVRTQEIANGDFCLLGEDSRDYSEILPRSVAQQIFRLRRPREEHVGLLIFLLMFLVVGVVVVCTQYVAVALMLSLGG